MATKKRVSDLAKELGKPSRELVKILRELGFEKVKSTQSTLDDADLLQIQARLEAYGIIAMPRSSAAAGEAPGAEPASATEAAAPVAEELPPPPALEPEAVEAPPGEVPEIPVEPLFEEEPAPAELVGSQEEVFAEDTPEEAVALDEEVDTLGEAVALDEEADALQEAETMAAKEAVLEPVEAGSQVDPETATEESLPAAAEARPQPAAEGAASKVRRAQKRRGATILGHIQLSQDVRSDAARRSRPPGEVEADRAHTVDRTLRERALQDMRSRASRSTLPGRGEAAALLGSPYTRHGQGARTSGPPPGVSKGTGYSGPSRTFPNFRRSGGGSLRPERRTSATLKSTVDPGKPVTVSLPVSVKDLSQALGIKVGDLLRVLFVELKVTAQINSFLEQHVVELVAEALGRKVIFKDSKDTEETYLDELLGQAGTPEDLQPRPPVVTILGHVDHGKTSIIDRIRKANVAAGEAGGITQHIGAYRVRTERGHEIVVIDTPGHEAFTQMRARGAQVTDIAILVVAADDGVMPTTEEAINHALAAKVPIVVALNKIDKPDANPLRAKQQLSAKGLVAEEWGGPVGIVPTSAVTGQGIEDLVERVVLEAEVLDLHADPSLSAQGTVLEAKQTPEEGTVVTFLVQNGTLRRGDNVLCGKTVGRVRILKDDKGQPLEEAGPAWPVQVIGLPELPEVGSRFVAVNDMKKGREIAEKRADQEREKRLAEKGTISIGRLAEQIARREQDKVRVVLKVDVKGSLEPLRNSISQLKHEEVGVEVVHAGVGAVTEADVDLAEASKALVIAFSVPADELARVKAEERSVSISFYDVIYDVIDNIKAVVEGRLKPVEKEAHLGTAEVRQIFKFQKHSIAGCYVLEGVAQRNAKVRLQREGKTLFTGRLASLRREKDDAREVKAGLECGMMLDGYDQIQQGDKLEFFEIQFEKRTL